jgi:hypothetical protein
MLIKVQSLIYLVSYVLNYDHTINKHNLQSNSLLVLSSISRIFYGSDSYHNFKVLHTVSTQTRMLYGDVIFLHFSFRIFFSLVDNS